MSNINKKKRTILSKNSKLVVRIALTQGFSGRIAQIQHKMKPM